jgi:F-type H+-transporting ATPase subunit b
MELVTPGLGLLFWMLITFSVLLFILKKFAWKPIINTLHEREKSIEKALLSAEKAKQEMSRLKSDNERILAEARGERENILKEARQVKDKVIQDAKEQAQIEAKKIVDSARASIEAEKSAAIADIKNQIADISVSIAEKLIKQKLDGAGHADLIDQSLKDLKLN